MSTKTDDDDDDDDEGEAGIICFNEFKQKTFIFQLITIVTRI